MLLDATESPLADSGNEDVSLAQIAEMAGHAAGIARLHVDLADISLHLLNKLMSRSVSFEALAWMPVVPSHLGDNIVEFSVTGSALPTCCPLLPIPHVMDGRSEVLQPEWLFLGGGMYFYHVALGATSADRRGKKCSGGSLVSSREDVVRASVNGPRGGEAKVAGCG